MERAEMKRQSAISTIQVKQKEVNSATSYLQKEIQREQKNKGERNLVFTTGYNNGQTTLKLGKKQKPVDQLIQEFKKNGKNLPQEIEPDVEMI